MNQLITNRRTRMRTTLSRSDIKLWNGLGDKMGKEHRTDLYSEMMEIKDETNNRRFRGCKIKTNAGNF
jgi:hypothetical protein